MEHSTAIKDTGKLRKRRGPVKRLPAMVDTHVFLPQELLDWAKEQPEGFAPLVRQLLKRARQKAERNRKEL